MSLFKKIIFFIPEYVHIWGLNFMNPLYRANEVLFSRIEVKLLDYTRRARVVPKRLFVLGEPESSQVDGWRIMTLSKIQNPSIIFATNQQILARNLLISGIERDTGRTRTDGRTNIDFF